MTSVVTEKGAEVSRYIDIDDAIEIVTKTQGMWATTLHALCDAPKIDIVRCEECKWYKDFDGCFFSTAEVDANGFCSYGERSDT